MSAPSLDSINQARDDVRTEYLSLLENMRHYHNHRFQQLTLWAAIVAALITALFSSSLPKGMLSYAIKGTGIVVSLTFWTMDTRIVDHWRHFLRRAVALEGLLGYAQFRDRPKREILGSTNATRLLYGFTLLFFVLTLWH